MGHFWHVWHSKGRVFGTAWWVMTSLCWIFKVVQLDFINIRSTLCSVLQYQYWYTCMKTDVIIIITDIKNKSKGTGSCNVWVLPSSADPFQRLRSLYHSPCLCPSPRYRHFYPPHHPLCTHTHTQTHYFRSHFTYSLTTWEYIVSCVRLAHNHTGRNQQSLVVEVPCNGLEEIKCLAVDASSHDGRMTDFARQMKF